MRINCLKLAVPLMSVLLTLASTQANAAKFGVRVVSPDGTPVAGAAVCIGTHGDYKKFGAMFTSADGDVLVEVPPVPLVVTVSKTRFSGVRLDEPARRFNLVKTIKLHDGVPGPRCRADSSLANSGASNQTAPQINSVDISDRAFNVQVKPNVTGSANHYRISRSETMRNASWQSLSNGGSIVVGPDMLGKTVYVQVRKAKQVKGATLETQSNIFPVNLTGY